MTDRIIPFANGFWNIRGSFRIAGLLDIGTQASLVRLHSGSFVLLDSYTLSGDVASEVLQRTDQGRDIEAIINLHPFHTVHVEPMARMFPKAKLYGTKRHHAKAPGLAWQPIYTDDPKLCEAFEGDLRFGVPRGVDFISANERIHFSSVLAFHPASRTLHVDDTLIWNPLPIVGGLRFHPTLKSALRRDPRAASEFRAWARELVEETAAIDHVCTAHASPMPPASTIGGTVKQHVERALERVEGVLSSHERRFQRVGK